MTKLTSERALMALATALFSLSVLLAGVAPRPSRALPVYARRYGVTCETCHSVAPALNAFGRAFQANHFNWPGGSPPAYNAGLKALPISGLATFSQIRTQAGGTGRAEFRTLELYLSDGFSLGAGRRGGFFFDDFAATADVRAGNLENAFVSLPIAGRRGQWALTAGQFAPMMYQYDPLNSLTQSLPVALANSLDAFSFADANPAVQLEFFNNQGRGTADGDYLRLGVPFQGHLTVNSDSRLYGPRGVFVHAFRRHGETSLGVFGYSHAGSHLEGVIGTDALWGRLYLLGIGAVGHDDSGDTRRLSLEANYVADPRLALTARLEALGGSRQDSVLYPVAAVTYYPLRLRVLRLTGETIQAKGNRSAALFVSVQF